MPGNEEVNTQAYFDSLLRGDGLDTGGRPRDTSDLRRRVLYSNAVVADANRRAAQEQSQGGQSLIGALQDQEKAARQEESATINAYDQLMESDTRGWERSGNEPDPLDHALIRSEHAGGVANAWQQVREQVSEANLQSLAELRRHPQARGAYINAYRLQQAYDQNYPPPQAGQQSVTQAVQRSNEFLSGQSRGTVPSQNPGQGVGQGVGHGTEPPQSQRQGPGQGGRGRAAR